MEMTRKGWETIRPPAYKGGGTGQMIDDYNGIKPVALDAILAEKNYDVAVRLNNHLADRRKDAKVGDFYSEKDEKKHQEKLKEEEKKEPKKRKNLGSSPRDRGYEMYEVYRSELGKWMETIKSEYGRLKKEIQQADNDQKEILLELANGIAKEVSTEVQTSYIDKLDALLVKYSDGDEKLKSQVQKLAAVLVKDMEKKYGIYDNNLSFTGMAVKQFAKVHKIAPRDDNYPKGTWGTNVGKLLDTARNTAGKLV